MVCCILLAVLIFDLFHFSSRLECSGRYLDATEGTTSSMATRTTPTSAAATAASTVFTRRSAYSTSWSTTNWDDVSTITTNTTWYGSTLSPATGWFKYHSGKFNDDKY
jgi:hypothetical protein